MLYLQTNLLPSATFLLKDAHMSRLRGVQSLARVTLGVRQQYTLNRPLWSLFPVLQVWAVLERECFSPGMKTFKTNAFSSSNFATVLHSRTWIWAIIWHVHKCPVLCVMTDEHNSAFSNMEVTDRLMYLEQRLQMQEDEVQLLKIALADVLKRLNISEAQTAALTKRGPVQGTTLPHIYLL